ncbi:DUF2955 domain-containing protein [Lysobacter sp. S4-A87]|uniref:DUF2955 domain-containing protein n=1 Tax=Lysobacter sp. S4-A87 TaxID=2925843 RepID=UPI001F53AEE7|nr:DUF2955 domain-containing protein [Lysobacter sp. S4-A87]UNK48707.1 DUF2955 domain-containing protein [Lysobacter sp. S4-A87]
MARQPLAISEDAWRQACRLTIGTLAGLAIAKALDWPFGVFFALYPVLLLGLVPFYKFRVAAQFIASSVVSIAAANVLAILGNVSPVLAICAFFLLAVFCFRLMALGPFFLFGALTMVSTSVLVHLASYPFVPVRDLFAAQFIATLIAAFLSAAVHALLPERRPMQPPGPPRPVPFVRHQMMLGGVCATVSFVAFQLLDLSDSPSAQAATVLILFPMTLAGGRRAAWTRVVGTLLGTVFALAVQLLLYTHLGNAVFVLALYGIGALLFATMHVRENAGPAVGLSAATAIAVLMGQLAPSSDLYGVSLYRLSSVAVAILAMLLCMFAVETVLNRFAATRIAPVRT